MKIFLSLFLIWNLSTYSLTAQNYAKLLKCKVTFSDKKTKKYKAAYSTSDSSIFFLSDMDTISLKNPIEIPISNIKTLEFLTKDYTLRGLEIGLGIWLVFIVPLEFGLGMEGNGSLNSNGTPINNFPSTMSTIGETGLFFGAIGALFGTISSPDNYIIKLNSDQSTYISKRKKIQKYTMTGN